MVGRSAADESLMTFVTDTKRCKQVSQLTPAGHNTRLLPQPFFLIALTH
jgi:hypothetical protein